MTIRATALTAAMLMALSSPALAQGVYDPGEPPPLPELPRHYEDVDDGGPWIDDRDLDAPYGAYPGAPVDEYEAGGWERRDPPRHAPGYARPVGYSASERAAWIDECRARLASAPAYCESYLLEYERAYRGAPAGHAAGGPAMWVRVPILRERRRDCACEQAATPARRIEAAPRAPTKIRRLRSIK